MGPKRKRVESSDDEDFSDASEPIDARGSTAKKSKGSTKRGHVKHDSSEDDETDCAHVNTHSVSLHRLERVNELQKDLLDWFDGVHDKRGMPWRKRYDPTLGPDERAQRAYEVAKVNSNECRSLNHYPIGLGLRDNASADPSSDRHSVL